MRLILIIILAICISGCSVVQNVFNKDEEADIPDTENVVDTVAVEQDGEILYASDDVDVTLVNDIVDEVASKVLLQLGIYVKSEDIVDVELLLEDNSFIGNKDTELIEVPMNESSASFYISVIDVDGNEKIRELITVSVETTGKVIELLDNDFATLNLVKYSISPSGNEAVVTLDLVAKTEGIVLNFIYSETTMSLPENKELTLPIIEDSISFTVVGNEEEVELFREDIEYKIESVDTVYEAPASSDNEKIIYDTGNVNIENIDYYYSEGVYSYYFQVKNGYNKRIYITFGNGNKTIVDPYFSEVNAGATKEVVCNFRVTPSQNNDSPYINVILLETYKHSYKNLSKFSFVIQEETVE
ncbi:MAG: hypothetical protein LBS29_04430 [Endomicrobium sp.]|jgi:hypothetical protein|nr:hypothetical protein [Endomicrobium sp.]